MESVTIDKAVQAHCSLCSFIGTHGKCVLTNDPDKCEDVIHIKKFLQQ